MDSFKYENVGSNTFLSYYLKENESLDTLSLGMITNNRIPGLAPAFFTQMDTQKYIKYNVTAKISVKQLFEGQVNKKRLIGVFTGITNALISAEDYMIDINSIVLNLDYIFADVSSCDTVLICLPVNQQEEKVDMLSFLKKIMFSSQFDQTENCDYVAKIINYLNSAVIFSPVDFKKVLDSVSSKKVDTDNSNRPTSQSANKVNLSQPKVKSVVTQQPVVSQPIVKQEKKEFIPPKDSVRQVEKGLPDNYPSSKVKTGYNNEEKITFMYLMQHYNKENVAKYKAQKATKKSKNVKNGGKELPLKKQSQRTFTVPGAPTKVDFAIPGQPIPPPQPQLNEPVQHSATPQVHTIPQAQRSVQSTYTPLAVPRSQSANFGETTVLGGGGIGETTVLGASSPEVKNTPHLIRTKNNERINLDKPVFRIGKEKSYVDYFVSDNTAVSRSHANIITRDDKYFIVDTNSTNHTYVNGGMIQSNVETALSHGTKIRLANEDFEFKLY
ncbi:MAG: DUF6382 domain-containing protein [Lachnospira sp.]